MNHVKFCQMTVISIGIFALNAIGINPATAGQPTAKLDLAAKPGAGLDIGLQPILSKTSNSRIALQQGAAAQEKQPLGIGVTTRVGTLGIGIDVAKSITPQFDARLGFNFGSASSSRTESGIDYDASLNLSSIQLLGDYHPFGGGFRITGGLLSQNNKFSVVSKPNSSGSYTIGGISYPASQVGGITGEYTFGNSIAPYLGIGFGQPANEGFGFNADLGVLFTGSPKVTLNATNPVFNNTPITRTPLDNQARQTENDLKGFNIYPVLSIGLSYGF